MFNFLRVVFPEEAKPKGFWTKDGKKIPGSDFEGPPGANDVELTIAVFWTRNGKRIGDPALPPPGANDVTLDLTGGRGAPEGGGGGRRGKEREQRSSH